MVKLCDCVWILWVLMFVVQLSIGFSEKPEFQKPTGKRKRHERCREENPTDESRIQTIHRSYAKQVASSAFPSSFQDFRNQMQLDTNNTKNQGSQSKSNRRTETINLNKHANEIKAVNSQNQNSTKTNYNERRDLITYKKSKFEPRTGMILLTTIGLIEALIVMSATLGLTGVSLIGLHFLIKAFLVLFGGIYLL